MRRGQHEVAAGRPPRYRHAVGVNREGGVGEDAADEGLDVVDGRREGRRGGFGVVESDDEEAVALGEGAVPVVVVVRLAYGEAAAVGGDEGGELGGFGRRGRGLV